VGDLVLNRWLICLLMLTAVLGCKPAGNERFVPTTQLAREALAASLDAWTRETETPQFPGGAPQIQFADSLRTGRRLNRFEIVGELPIQGGRRFEVELFLDDSLRTEKAQYVVLGIDPLWVIRQEDYDMITHWDHPMPKEEVAAAEPDVAESAGAESDE
jgi:hypothetical protein